MRFFAYVDLTLRYEWIKFRMERMRRKLKRQIDKDNLEITKLIEELTNDR
jgi:hypothetical protein